MEHSKAITKKLKDEIFIWDPTAYSNKGYWYVLGTTGAFGRPASKAEGKKLGKPPKEETQPVAPEVIEESDEVVDTSKAAQYRKARRDRKTPFSEMIFKKVFEEGEGLGSAIKSSVSDKFKADITSLKEKFDPINIAKSLFGNKITAILGRKLGANDEDIEYFTGYKNKTAKDVDTATKIGGIDSEVAEPLYSKVTPGNKTRVRTKESVANVLAKLYNLIKGHHDLEIKENELHRIEQRKNEELKNAWNKQLIEALTGKKSQTPDVPIKDFNKFAKDLYKKLKEMAESIGGGVSSTAEELIKSQALKRAGAAALEAVGGGAVVAGAAVIGGAAVGGVVAQKLQKEAIEKDPWNPKYDNIPYALTVRGVAKNDGEAAKILKDRSTKQIPYPQVEELYKMDPKLAEDEIGLPEQKIKEFLDNPENKKRNIQGIPKSERIKQEKAEKAAKVSAAEKVDSGDNVVTAKKEEPKKEETAAKAIENVNKKVVESAPKETATPEKKTKETKAPDAPTTPMPKATTQSAGNEAKDLSGVAKPAPQPEKDNTLKLEKVVSENNELTDMESSGNGNTVVADNSQKINIINQNTDGLLVEELTGVRIEQKDEPTLYKIMRQNLRMV
jgi:hypothetical protein